MKCSKFVFYSSKLVMLWCMICWFAVQSERFWGLGLIELLSCSNLAQKDREDLVMFLTSFSILHLAPASTLSDFCLALPLSSPIRGLTEACVLLRRCLERRGLNSEHVTHPSYSNSNCIVYLRAVTQCWVIRWLPF